VTHSLAHTEKQEILRRVYALEANLPVPCLVQPFGKWYATGDLMEDMELDLARQMERNRLQEAVDDFYVPHFKAGVGLGALAAAFGCSSEWNEGSDAWILPRIETDPQRVYELTLPDPHTSGSNALAFERLAFFARQGLLVQPCNIASPLTTASYIWGYSDFLDALIHHPREVHHLLELVTEATIRFVRAQMAAVTNLYGLTHEDWWMGSELGIRVSDDVLAVISPRHYREFGVHYNNILSREFGGVVIHSCGNIVHQVPAILEHEGLVAVDLALPHNDPVALARVAAGKTALTMRYWIQDWENQPMPDLEEYTDRMVEIFGTRGVLLQMQAPTHTNCIALAEAIRRKPWGRV
jgi:Uroporphyrinogen decarboxylase (URO-D)